MYFIALLLSAPLNHTVFLNSGLKYYKTDTTVRGQTYAHHSCHGVAAQERSQAFAMLTGDVDGVKRKFISTASSNTFSTLMAALP